MSSSVYTIASPSWKAIVFIAAMAALPGVLTYVSTRMVGGSQAGLLAVAVTALASPVFIFLFAQLFLVKVVVSPTQLQAGGGLYKIQVPLSALRLQEAKSSTSKADAPRLGLRSNGIGMPGLQLGWFMVNGKKTFVAVSDMRGSVYIPTALDYDLIVAPQDREGFLHEVAAKQAAMRK